MYSVAVRHTKIIATIGPASSDLEVIKQLVVTGVDVFRLNFSHGDAESHAAVLRSIRDVAAQAGREVAVLQDLSGPKIRTGRLENGTPILLSAGEPLEIRIGTEVGRRGSISTPYAPLAAAVRPGDHLLLDDGKIDLAVEGSSPSAIATRVVDGGALGEHKGINAPNVPLPATGVTEKDEKDLRFGLAAGVDLVALSFVQSADDIAHARAITAAAGRSGVPIVAKLERPEAIRCLEAIVATADAVMVARGDLGLEMPLEQVPQVQKQVLRAARERGVPVIVATQVLESMRTESRPTRAEVSDAAGAVDAGADAIMLSGETAVGNHPVRAVQVLDSIVRNAEAVPPIWTLPAPSPEGRDHLSALSDAAVTLAAHGGAHAIIAITREGRTARLLSARRPGVPILAVTDSPDVARRLSLWWGVTPVIDSIEGETARVVDRIASRLRQRGHLASSAVAVIVNTSPDLESRSGNVLGIRRI